MPDEPRRVRTQAERDTDGTAWRAVAHTRPGYATYPQTAPGSPSWWRRDPIRGLSPVARVMAGLDGPPPVDGETCARWCGYCHLPADAKPPSAEEMETAVREAITTGQPVTLSSGSVISPRRRWWHRLTRRAL